MTLLIFYLFLALGVSFFCSIMEAVILSLTPSYVEALEKRDPKTAAILRRMKANIDRPLAAILTLNTIAHTVGAAGVGAQAALVFGNAYVAVISAVLTFLILVFSEIIPKSLGAFYWQQLAASAARLLPPLIWVLHPLVVMSQVIVNWIAPKQDIGAISREELWAMTDLARKEGLFGERESRILKNLLRVGKLRVKDIMTPRPVTFMLPAAMRISDVMDVYPDLRFSRIPIHGENKEDVNAFVLKSDIMHEVSQERLDTPLHELGRPMRVVPEVVNLIYIFDQFLNEHEHIALVVDEYGGTAGIVTMEDVIETMLGIEIVDESDDAIDMQAMARQQWTQRAQRLGIVPDEETQSSNQS